MLKKKWMDTAINHLFKLQSSAYVSIQNTLGNPRWKRRRPPHPKNYSDTACGGEYGVGGVDPQATHQVP